MALVSKLTMPTERPSLVGEVIANFAHRGCCVVNATDLHGRILGFLDRIRYYFFQVLVLTRLSGPLSRPATRKIW
jgi:hypothetical protein